MSLDLTRIIISSIKNCILTDENFGIAFSGGIDTPLLAKISRDIYKENVILLSIGFPCSDDLDFEKDRKELNMKHFTHEIKNEEFNNISRKVIDNLECIGRGHDPRVVEVVEGVLGDRAEQPGGPAAGRGPPRPRRGGSCVSTTPPRCRRRAGAASAGRRPRRRRPSGGELSAAASASRTPVIDRHDRQIGPAAHDAGAAERAGPAVGRRPVHRVQALVLEEEDRVGSRIAAAQEPASAGDDGHDDLQARDAVEPRAAGLRVDRAEAPAAADGRSGRRAGRCGGRPTDTGTSPTG